MKASYWMGKVQAVGCIVCIREMLGATPAEVHHILRNGRRIDDYHVLPLCTLHHRGQRNDATLTSRHPYHRAFEKRYGSEWDLLRAVLQIIGDPIPTALRVI